MRLLENRKTFAGLLATLAILAGVGVWMGRKPILSWYYFRELSKADETNRDIWVERVAGLDRDAVPGLIGCLKQDDATACGNAGLVLVKLTEAWELQDLRTSELARDLERSFASLSVAGQQTVLALELGWFRDAPKQMPKEMVEAMIQTVKEAVRGPSRDIRLQGYELLGAIVLREERPDLLVRSRELIRQGMKDSDPTVRSQAVLSARAEQLELMPAVAGLLRDPSPEVRRAAMRAVAASPTVVPDEDLREFLNDEDPEVCLACETALRKRGVPEDKILLARLVGDPKIAGKFQAIHELRSNSSIDPTIWYQRLTRDNNPSVQVAAIRAASSSRVDLRGNIEEISRSDPSPTVRQLAAYYLERR